MFCGVSLQTAVLFRSIYPSKPSHWGDTFVNMPGEACVMCVCVCVHSSERVVSRGNFTQFVFSPVTAYTSNVWAHVEEAQGVFDYLRAKCLENK